MRGGRPDIDLPEESWISRWCKKMDLLNSKSSRKATCKEVGPELEWGFAQISFTLPGLDSQEPPRSCRDPIGGWGKPVPCSAPPWVLPPELPSLSVHQP